MERKLYYTLVAAIDGEFLILAQVNMNGFIEPVKGQDIRAARSTIKTRSVDYLLCSKDGKAFTAIELQDETHKKLERQDDDAKKAAALKSAGVPLIEFHARNLPTVDEIRAKIREVADRHN